MRTKFYKRSDGTQGVVYYPENKDKFVSLYKAVGESQHPALVENSLSLLKQHF